MKGNETIKTLTNIIYPAFALVAFACFALSPQAGAQCPQGCDSINNNTFLGDGAFPSNTGVNNTAIGSGALFNKTTGVNNTAIGTPDLEFNTTGSGNTAIGAQVLEFNGAGNDNTAIGSEALHANNGNQNTATGDSALVANTTGFNNTASGFDGLFNNMTGHNNTADGYSALALNTGSSNIAIGSNAGFNLITGSNNIDIGSVGAEGESNTIRLGTRGTQRKTLIAGISGATVPGGVGVIVGSNGQLGTVLSSERFKEAVKPMDKASEAILALKPVTFFYKHDLDHEGIPQFGLIAEQVAKVNPDLVARDEQGKPYTVRYEAVNAMLLNEFLKEHKRVQEQEATIAELKSTLAEQQKAFDSKVAKQQSQIEALTVGLQKVNLRLEVSKAAPQTVQNNQ